MKKKKKGKIKNKKILKEEGNGMVSNIYFLEQSYSYLKICNFYVFLFCNFYVQFSSRQEQHFFFF
tara:strand:+ start:73 stop:267 length:195 start_codon:yes stop_codon:yes gene_type:complete